MPSKLRAAMMGGGPGAFFGAVHRTAMKVSGRFDLVAGVFSRNADASAAMGAELGLEGHAYGDLDSLLAAEGEALDVLVVVTPNATHFPLSKQAMEAGLHVFCEKPATLTLEEAIELKQVQQATGKHYGLAHTYLGYPLMRQMRQMVADGAIGEVRRIDSTYKQGWLSDPLEQGDNKQANWRTDPAKAGKGGAIGDIGTHAFNGAEFVSGQKIETLTAQVNTFVEGRALDDDASAFFITDGGAKGTLAASQICNGLENDFRIGIYGSKGSLEWRQEEPNSVTFRQGDGNIRILRAGANAPNLFDDINAMGRLPMGHPEGFHEALANLYVDFANAIQGSGEPPAGVDAAIRGMAFVEAMIASSEASAAVSLSKLIEGSPL